MMTSKYLSPRKYKFLKAIGMWLSLGGLKVPENELPQLTKQCLVLPDYKSNPGIATLEDITELLKLSFRR
jgi:alcohol dehydrogenase class IV